MDAAAESKNEWITKELRASLNYLCKLCYMPFLCGLYNIV